MRVAISTLCRESDLGLKGHCVNAICRLRGVARDSQIVIRDSGDELRSRRSRQSETSFVLLIEELHSALSQLGSRVRSRARPYSRALRAKQSQRFGCQSPTRPGRLRLEGRSKVAPKAVFGKRPLIVSTSSPMRIHRLNFWRRSRMWIGRAHSASCTLPRCR